MAVSPFGRARHAHSYYKPLGHAGARVRGADEENTLRTGQSTVLHLSPSIYPGPRWIRAEPVPPTLSTGSCTDRARDALLTVQRCSRGCRIFSNSDGFRSFASFLTDLCPSPPRVSMICQLLERTCAPVSTGSKFYSSRLSLFVECPSRSCRESTRGILSLRGLCE